MRVVLQRVSRASVSVEGELVSEIGEGLCLLVGIEREDGDGEVSAAVDKIIGLRVFGDEIGKMNLNIGDVDGEILVVSQFTLLGDVRKGRRPSFTRAAQPARAAPLVMAMAEAFDRVGIKTRTGVFGAKMSVEIANNGPVTLVLDISDGQVQ
ncbi:MAG TPA: D-aminoacyl-tRNA deacylase [Acidimicrobiia bacterium]